MKSYNTHPNPYAKHLSSEEVLQKRLEKIDQNLWQYLRLYLIGLGLLLLTLFAVICTVRFAFLIF